MFRIFAIVLFLVALVVLAVDSYSSLTGEGEWRLFALGEWWAWIDRDSLLLLQPAVERHLSPDLWDPGIQTVLEWPAAADLAGLGAFFWLFRRRRRRGRRAIR